MGASIASTPVICLFLSLFHVKVKVRCFWILCTRPRQIHLGTAAHLGIVYGEPDGIPLPEAGSDWSVRLADSVTSGRQEE